MHAITIPQPRAWAISSGLLKVSGFERSISHLGPVLIHAASTRKLIESPEVQEFRLPPASELAFGALVGIGDLAECVSTRHPMTGRVVWLLRFERMRPIEPVRIKSRRRGLWFVDEATRAQVREIEAV